MKDIHALAAWLERRPQLDHDVFCRGQPDFFGNAVEAWQAIDVVEFLWTSLALLDDEAAVDTTEVYRARPFALYQVAEARARIPRLLAEAPDVAQFERLLPAPPEIADSESHRALRRRSAWSSTLIAGLDLAKQGEVVLGQG